MMIETWMHQKEIDLVEKYLKPETIMLEWGSGGSTLQFSKLVKRYFSIENNRKWFDKVRLDINKNTELFYAPEITKEEILHSTYGNYKYYVDKGGYIAKDYNIKFDVVLIDGRARVDCAKHIIPHLSADAIVFVHDFWKHTRARYQPILEYYNEVESEKSTRATIIALKPKEKIQ